MRASPTPQADVSRHPGHFVVRLLLLWCLLFGGFQFQPVSLAPVAAQDLPPGCQREAHPGGSYVAQWCLTTSVADDVLSGSSPASVTVTEANGGTLPTIEWVRFSLAIPGSTSHPTILTDYQTPWSVTIPTTYWKDGSYRLEARVRFKASTTAASFEARTFAVLNVTLQNGVAQGQQSDNSWLPKTSTSLNIVAVGDGAGGLPGADQVGALAQQLNPDQLLYLGDVYNSGTYTEFTNYYAPTLGPLYNRTNPVPGNHETGSPGYALKGYRDYWNMPAQTWYSYNSGGWHFIAIDSTAATGVGSAQYNWFVNDLQANANTACTIAFFHHPRFGLDANRGSAYMQDMWALLATQGVDVVLTGHEHNYQRWKPMNASGQIVNNGMAQYVVGTGGHELLNIGPGDDRVARWITGKDGVLQLSLGTGGGSAKFIGTDGTTYDQSNFTCHNGEGGGAYEPPHEPWPSDPTVPVTLNPVADTYVSASYPDTNYGKITSLRADNSPQEAAYLRFDVDGLTAPPDRVTLRLRVTDGTTNAPEVARSDNTTWSEHGTTWNTRPAAGTPVTNVGAASKDTWLEYDVTSLVTGDGLVTFALVAQSTDALFVASREDLTAPPQLVIERDVVQTPPPEPAPSATFTPEADARVQEANPTINYGTGTNPYLRADGGTDLDVETYLRFTVSEVSGTPTGATLRLFVPNTTNAGSNNGPALYTSTDTTWSETGITWSNRPARTTTALDDKGAVAAGAWFEFAIPASVVPGNGTYTFVVATSSTDATDMASRETATAPQLILHGVTASGTTPPPPPPPSGEITVTSVADARVQEANLTSNYGTSSALRVDGASDPDIETYLRFTVPELSGPVTSAKVRLYVPTTSNATGSTNGPKIYAESNTSWIESGTGGITWATRPQTRGTTFLYDLVVVTAGTWVELDVTAAITGAGTYSFVLVPDSNDAADFASRETSGTANDPQLVITSAGSTSTQTTTARRASVAVEAGASPVASPGGVATPVVVATQTPTPTATVVPTPTATLVPPTPSPVPPTATLVPTPAPTMAPTPTPGLPADPAIPVVLAPVADAMVTDAQPDASAGWRTELSANQAPQEVSVIRFDVQGLTQPVSRATLRLYVLDGTANGPLLAGSPNTAWDEGTLTWNTRPEIGTVVANVDAVATGIWVEYDVTSLVSSNGPVSFVLVAESPDALIVASREQGTAAPQLVIEQVVPSTPTPVPPPTPEPTLVPPPTLVPAPTLAPAPTPEPTLVPIPTDVPTEVPLPTVVEPAAPPVAEPTVPAG